MLQVDVPPEVRAAGVQDTESSDGRVVVAGATVREAVLETPLRLAVIITAWLVDTVPAFAVKLALDDPAGTNMFCGIVTAGALLSIATVTLDVAVCESTTVQVAVAVEFSAAGAHDTELNEGDGEDEAPESVAANSTGGRPFMSAITLVTEPAAPFPRNKVAEALPCESVVEISEDTRPFPSVIAKCTTAFGTGFPELSLASTLRGLATAEPAAPV
jgi:hypothetical protein